MWPTPMRKGQEWWFRARERFNPTERQRLFGVTVVIGGICGLVAVAFHQCIRWFERLTIERAFAAENWGIWVVCVVVLGALVAGVMLHHVPGARGSGVPQVKVAYAISVMKLRMRDSLAKFAIGTVQIGTGSSLGREGPTVQICSGVAKGLGRIAGISPHNLKLLLPAGAAAGIAAAFNAPIAAVTFTVEEIVGKLDQTLLSGVIVAAALAAAVERSILGENPVFSIPMGYGLDHASSLLVYAGLGIAAGLISVAFTESLLRLRKWFSALKRIPVWLRPAIGGAVTGLVAVGVMLAIHVDGITGGGYQSLVAALSGRYTLTVMLLLCVAKIVATVFSYSSGGAGGIFAPSLFIGAMLGGAFGVLDVEVLGHAHAEVGSFALVGMGAVFAGTVRAPITSVLIIIEMTAGYGLALPLMISNMIAYSLARRLRPLPIYEAFLVQDGIELHPARPADPIEGLTIEGVALSQLPHATFAPGTNTSEMLLTVETAGRQEVFPVIDGHEQLVGIVTLEDLTLLAEERHVEGLVCAGDIMRPPSALVPHEPLSRALDLMASIGVRELPVVDHSRRVLGIIDEAAIARQYVRALAVARGNRKQTLE